MKIAVVHDWLVTNAGAEKVLSAILELYPEADVFSLVDFLLFMAFDYFFDLPNGFAMVRAALFIVFFYLPEAGL